MFCTVILYNSHFPLTSHLCVVDHFNFDSLHCYFPIILCAAYPIPISFHHFFIQIPLIFSFVIPIGALNGVFGFDCMPSDDGFCPESKTDTGHECGIYMWFVDLYIGKFDPYCHLTSDLTVCMIFVCWIRVRELLLQCQSNYKFTTHGSCILTLTK